MRLLATFAVWLVCPCSLALQDAPNAYVRFFNDSAKAVEFYVDGRFGCSVPANPEGNNAYCDAETTVGKHTVSAKGAKLPSNSCDLYIGQGAGEAHMSKGERFRCFSKVTD
jgi:hypothetical protein